MRKKWLAVLCAVLVGVGTFALATTASAESISGSSSGVTKITNGQTVDGAAFLAGNTVSVEGTVNGDVFCAGNDVTVNGTVNGDVICAGNTVVVGGTVNGDVRAAGSVVRIDGSVSGSVTIAGSSVQIAHSANIEQDALLLGNTVDVQGVIQRDINASASTVTIASNIGRNVEVTAATFSLEGGKIAGNLRYRVSGDTAIPEASVGGTVVRLEAQQVATTAGNGMTALAFVALMGVLTATVLTLVVVLAMPRYVRRVTDIRPIGLLKAFLVGLASIGLLIPLMIMLVISLVGATVGLTVLIGFVLACLLALPLVAFWIGKAILGQTSRSLPLIALVGALVLSIASVIPWIGTLVLFVAVCVGLGMILLGFKSQYGEGAYVLESATIAAKPEPAPAKKKSTKR